MTTPLIFMSKKTLRNYAASVEHQRDRFERIVNHLTDYTSTLEVERNELRDRQHVVVTLIEAELADRHTVAPEHRDTAAIAFLENLLMQMRPARLTPAAWADQEIT